MPATPSIQGKDLTKEAPRSPSTRIGNYVLMARMIDKGRALINGNIGEFHFDCPLDNMLFSFKGIKGDQVKPLLIQGKTDEEILNWFNSNGTPKTADEIKTWSEEKSKFTFHGNPEKGEWFDGECQRLGLDPSKASLFQMLEADDKTIGKESQQCTV